MEKTVQNAVWFNTVCFNRNTVVSWHHQNHLQTISLLLVCVCCPVITLSDSHTVLKQISSVEIYIIAVQSYLVLFWMNLDRTGQAQDSTPLIPWVLTKGLCIHRYEVKFPGIRNHLMLAGNFIGHLHFTWKKYKVFCIPLVVDWRKLQNMVQPNFGYNIWYISTPILRDKWYTDKLCLWLGGKHSPRLRSRVLDHDKDIQNLLWDRLESRNWLETIWLIHRGSKHRRKINTIYQ